MRILRDHGMNPKKRYSHDIVGYNYRMTNLQAALGCGQMEKIDYFLEKRREISETYKYYLEDNFVLQASYPRSAGTCWIFASAASAEQSYKDVSLLFKEKEIETRPSFIPLNLMDRIRIFRRVIWEFQKNFMIGLYVCLLL